MPKTSSTRENSAISVMKWYSIGLIGWGIYYFYSSRNPLEILLVLVGIITLLGIVKRQRFAVILAMLSLAFLIYDAVLSKSYLFLLLDVWILWNGQIAFRQLKTYPKKDEKKRHPLKFLISTSSWFFLAGTFLLAIYVFFFRSFQISSDSMYPAFKKNQYVLTNVIGLRFANPKYGDVIFFKYPVNPEKVFVGRVMGIKGDKIILKDGNIYLNSKIAGLNDGAKIYGGKFLKEGQTITVPSDNYFVLSDNKQYEDSRDWGFVQKNSIIGTVLFCYYNCTKSSLIDEKSNVINTGTENWKLFTSTDGSFQILFPSGNPKITYDKNLPIPESSLESRLLQFSDYDTDENSYYVEVSIFPDPFPKEQSYNNLSDWANNIEKGINATLLNSKQSKFMDAPSLELNLKGKSDNYNYRYRIFYLDRYSYAIASRSKSDKFPSFNVFANSFQFLQNQLSTNANISAPSPANDGFLSGANNSEDIKSLEDYVGSIQNAKNSWQNLYSSGNYPPQDLDKLLDELTRMISFSRTIIENLQSGNINNESSISLWNAVLKMSDEVAILVKKLNGQ